MSLTSHPGCLRLEVEISENVKIQNATCNTVGTEVVLTWMYVPSCFVPALDCDPSGF